MKTSFVHLVTEGISRQGLSLRKLAAQIDLDPSFFSKVLAGKRSPPSDEKILRKLAKILDIDPLLLIVATGRIPSELQELMENPDFLNKIYKNGTNFSERPKEPKKTSEFDHKVALPVLPRSTVLSEDLL